MGGGYLELGAVAWAGRYDVASPQHPGRLLEVLVKVVDPLHDPVLSGAGETDVVPGLEVRHHVAEPHPTGVRTDGHSLRSGEEEEINTYCPSQSHSPPWPPSDRRPTPRLVPSFWPSRSKYSNRANYKYNILLWPRLANTLFGQLNFSHGHF